MVKYFLGIFLLASLVLFSSTGLSQPIENLYNNKIGPGLKNKLIKERISEQQLFKVGIWVKKTDDNVANEAYVKKNFSKVLKREGENAARSLKAEVREQNKASVKDAMAPLMKYLEEQNIKVVNRSSHAPLVFVEITEGQLNLLLSRSDVVLVDISRTYSAELQNAGRTSRANSVWARGITGNLIQVAVVEDSGIEFDNPNLAEGSYYNSVFKDIEDHATGVAGIIASTHAEHRGVANGVPGLLSANAWDFDDDNLIKASDWAIDEGATVLNCSFGGNTNLQIALLDRYYDYIVRHDFVTVVKSAGNRGLSDGNVTSPGLGYNMITVGGIFANDDSVWSNDTMSSGSSFNNPVSPNGDREKPEVAAVSEDSSWNFISTLTADPWIGAIGGRGTSFAAPQVSGLAALLQQRAPSLAVWPEAVKAIIMASAIHNVEGDSRLSDRDGAGGIDCNLADKVVTENWWEKACITKDHFDASGNMDREIELLGGQTARVVIVWLSNPAGDYSDDPLDADLNLQIIDPDGNPVAGAVSDSWDNNFEIVEFMPAKTGNYKVRVTNRRFDGDTEFFAIAWAQNITTEKALQWLRDNQSANGSWQNHVAYTSMAALTFLNNGYTEDSVNTWDPIVTNAIEYILPLQEGDGSWSDYTYNTSVAIWALKATGNAGYNDKIADAAGYLKSIQSDDSDDNTHSWYGGWGYGSWSKNSWSDLSNSQFAAMALDAAGIDKSDQVWTRFKRYLSRVQNLDINDMAWADGRSDGGFTYSPHYNLWNNYNSYGSMTGAGIWGLRLSGVDVGEYRVQKARGWFEDYYTNNDPDLNFDENPMMGNNYRYYYYLSFAKAMAMCFLSQDQAGVWYEGYYDKLKAKIASEQHADGYWNRAQGTYPDTLFALLALQTQQPPAADLWMSVVLASPAELVVYDPQDRICSKDECTIPGATFEIDGDGHQVVTLPELEAGHYRFVLLGTGDGECHLTVKGYRGDAGDPGSSTETSSVEKVVDILNHQILKSDVLISSMVGALTIHVEDPEPPTDPNTGDPLPYDFDGDGDVDVVDIMKVASRWNSSLEGDNFFDFDDDGKITVIDIMKVAITWTGT